MKRIVRLLVILGVVLFALTGVATARTHHATAGSDPVLVGDTSVASMSDSNTSEIAQAFEYTASTSGTATDVEVYDRSGSTVKTMLVGIYSTTGGKPGALIASGSLSSPSSGAWDDVSLTPASITAGQSYWIALLPEGGTLNYVDTSSRTGVTSYVESNRSLTALPSSYVTGNEWPVSPMSAYVNGTTTPPPPVPPTDTGLPQISGTAMQGDTLTATDGTWSGDTPMTFSFLWSDGATGITDTLGASDVGQNVSVTVTATNDGGSANATSASVGPVAPIPVPPSNTAAPVISGTPQQGDTLTVSDGSWSGDTPMSFSYLWSDGTTGSSDTLSSSDVGQTITATVTATNDAGNASATSAGVGPVAPLPTVAPSNTVLPTISGTPQVGDTLTASQGSWSGDTPMTFTYLWSDGSTGSTDTLASGDAGAEITVAVTATNDGGHATATSAGVGPVTQQQQQTLNCAGTVGSGVPNYSAMDACGFPSPDTTGVPAGTTLTPYTGPSNITTAGTVIQDKEITSALSISASNVTIEDSDISVANQSTGGIRIGGGVTGLLVEYDSIHGTSATSAGNLQAGVYSTNYSAGANEVTIDHVDFYNGQRIMHGPGTVQNSFCLDNVAVSGAHYECVYEGGGGITINHNTFLTAFGQTAAIFISTDFAALTNVNITNNLLAGGGYVIYGDATNEHNYGIQSETITGNHFTRLYYADSGQYGPSDNEYLPSIATWSGNIWDDTGASVAR